MSAALIEARDLSKRFGGIVAVSNLDLVVRQGELVGLIGPNGSGKTTTINLLTGHLAPGGGQIFLRGQRVDARSPSEFAAWRVGRTFQITQLFSRMTVLENMLVPGLARPRSHKAAATRDGAPASWVSRARRSGNAAGQEPLGRPAEAAGAGPCADAGPRDPVPRRAVRRRESRSCATRSSSWCAGCTPRAAPSSSSITTSRRLQRLVHRMVVMSRGREDRRRHGGGGAREPGGAAGLCRDLTPHLY